MRRILSNIPQTIPLVELRRLVLSYEMAFVCSDVFWGDQSCLRCLLLIIYKYSNG